MKVGLQHWYDGWLAEHRDTDLIYAVPAKPTLHQVHFVRDSLSALFWQDIKYDDIPTEPERTDCRVSAWVIGEHTSKSVRLPVYSLERPDLELQIVARYNFHNWNVSVRSRQDLAIDIEGFGDFPDKDRMRYPTGDTHGNSWGGMFFEGFPHDLRFGPYAMNKRQFSLAPHSEYELYAFVRMLMKAARP